MEPAIQAILNTRNMVVSISDHIRLLSADIQVRVSALPDNEQAFIGHRSHQNQPCNMPVIQGLPKNWLQKQGPNLLGICNVKVPEFTDYATQQPINAPSIGNLLWYLAVDEPQLSYQRFHLDNLSCKPSCFPLTLYRYLGS